MLTSYKREGKAARQSRPQKASSRSGEVAEFTRPEGLLRFAAAVGRGGGKAPPYGAKDTWAVMAKSRAGHARPLRTAVKIYAREGQGRAAARPFAVGGVDRERVVTQGPLEPFRPCRLGQLP